MINSVPKICADIFPHIVAIYHKSFFEFLHLNILRQTIFLILLDRRTKYHLFLVA